MPMIVSKKQRIFFTLEGEAGTYLLLHHGLFGSHRDWYDRGYVNALQGEFQLIIPDARGHGRSEKPLDKAQYQLPLFAEDLVALLDHLDIRNIIFFGYSLGALVGFQFVTRFPERVRAAIRAGEGPLVTPAVQESWHTLGERLRQGSLGSLIQDLRDRELWMGNGEAAENDEAEEALPFLLEAMTEWEPNASERISVNCPVALFAGAKDPAVALTERSRNIIQRARFFSLPEMTTAGAMREKDLLLKEALEFIRSVRYPPERQQQRDAQAPGSLRGEQQEESAPPETAALPPAQEEAISQEPELAALAPAAEAAGGEGDFQQREAEPADAAPEAAEREPERKSYSPSEGDPAGETAEIMEPTQSGEDLTGTAADDEEPPPAAPEESGVPPLENQQAGEPDPPMESEANSAPPSPGEDYPEEEFPHAGDFTPPRVETPELERETEPAKPPLHAEVATGADPVKELAQEEPMGEDPGPRPDLANSGEVAARHEESSSPDSPPGEEPDGAQEIEKEGEDREFP